MKSSFGFMVYLAGLSMLGFLATDMYLPAFGVMQQQLNTSAKTISASLSIFLAGFAFAQLIWGPLSDRFGRKPILIIGLTLFAIGCLGNIWVNNGVQLLVFRFIQAVGVCSAAVTWQALVIDRFQISKTKRVFSTIMPLVALSPALAPLLGASLLEHYGWRSIFSALFIITILLLIPTFFLKDKKNAALATKKSGNISFWQIFKTPIFLGSVTIYAACSSAFFAWLTGSPFILGDMGYSPSDIGLSYVPQTFAFLIGGFGCRSLLNRVKSTVVLPCLLIGFSLSVLALYLIAQYTQPTLTTLLIPFCFMAIMNGACYPIVVANALEPFAQESGKAVALQNTLQLGLCFLASLAVSYFVSSPLLSTTVVMVSTIPLVALAYYIQLAGHRAALSVVTTSSVTTSSVTTSSAPASAVTLS